MIHFTPVNVKESWRITPQSLFSGHSDRTSQSVHIEFDPEIVGKSKGVLICHMVSLIFACTLIITSFRILSQWA